MAKPWDGVISDEEQRAYNGAGFGRATGLGKRISPAISVAHDAALTAAATVAQ